jgi:hypothetical protein
MWTFVWESVRINLCENTERGNNKEKFEITWADWKVLRLLLFLFPGIRSGNAILGFVKIIQWRVWTCSWTAVAFSIWSQRVEAPATFCHGGCGRRLCENTAEMWLDFVLNLERAVIKHLKCYDKHMVVKHLAVLQYFIGGGTSKTVTREWLTKHVLASAVLWCARDDLTALGSPWADSERRLLCKRLENPFAWSHEKEKTGFVQETMFLSPG